MSSRRLAGRVVGLILACLALGFSPAGTGAPAVGAAPATREAAPRNVAAWLPYWVFDDAMRGTVSNPDVVDSVSPFWFDAASCTRINDKATARDASAVARLRAQGFTVLPSVTAGGLTPRAAVRCLGNPSSRKAHVARLVRLATSGNYDGLDIDYENLALTTDVSQARRVRRAFTAFVEDLCPALRHNGRTCSITVMPRTSAKFSVWRGVLIPAVYDYTRLAAVADEVRVMAYDQHAGRFGPGPIAGFGWVKRVADFAIDEMGTDNVRLGIPTYGRQWRQGSTESVSMSGKSAVALARRAGAAVIWDRRHKEFRFTYRSGGRRHTVWYSGPRSVAVRARYADRRGFVGSALWAAGLEATGTWQALRQR
jgi:spore germination protein